MNPDDDPDSLAEVLGIADLPPLDPARRDAIFAQTRGVLWRRRWGRRGVWTAAFVACFFLGVLSGSRWNPVEVNNQLAARGTTEDANPAGAAKPGHATESTPRTKPAPGEDSHPDRSQPVRGPDGPSATIAEVAPAEFSMTRFEKLRRAGDRQLNERGNLQAALGCYRRALDCASDTELKIVPERDSWLLIPLKEARLEAGKHVQKKS